MQKDSKSQLDLIFDTSFWNVVYFGGIWFQYTFPDELGSIQLVMGKNFLLWKVMEKLCVYLIGKNDNEKSKQSKWRKLD